MSDLKELESKAKAEDVTNLGVIQDENIMRGRIRSRGVKRGALTKFLLKLSTSSIDDKTYLKFAIEKLKSFQESLLTLDSEIESFMLSGDQWNDSEHQKQTELVEEYQDKINMWLISLQNVKTDYDDANNITQQNLDRSINNVNKLKLPQIELPQFDGEPEMFERFITSFEHALSDSNLSQFSKYSLLLKQVSGPAKDIVESVQPGISDYDQAKVLLTSAFSNRAVQQFSVIDKLLKLRFVTATNPYKWVSDAKTLSDQVGRLGIDGEIFTQYFVWNSLPDHVKAQYISVTDCLKPKLGEILEKSFEVFNRIKETPLEISKPVFTPKPLKSRNETSAMVTGFDSNIGLDREGPEGGNKLDCFLCKYDKIKVDDHKVYNCPTYKNSRRKTERH